MKGLFLIFIFSFFFNISAQSNSDFEFEITREFRAAWIATVANINWPSKPGLSESKQKIEAIKLLDLLKNTNYNAVILQVRAQADAFYKSDLEPWSYYLTGEEGVAPDDFYDPLEFWIEEAHKRCLELHAWINPYRAHHKSNPTISENSIVRKKEDIVVPLKEGYWWFDPSLEETQDHAYNVVMDITRRYDIDGIHFDDYFYPYPSYNNEEDFPDDKSWNKYLASGGKLGRNDWRRYNVNKFIERIYTNIKLTKPYVKFGLSPFGIWRPNNPKSIKGFDQYDKLYADAKLWLNKGWVDYWAPLLYWQINRIDQSFPVLLNWWRSENFHNRFLWPGINIDHGNDELINEIMITRGMVSNNPGTLHWSIAPLLNDSTMAKELLKGPYKKQSLVPALSWHNIFPPKTPDADFSIEQDSINLKLVVDKRNGLRNWVVYSKYGDLWNYEISSVVKNRIVIPTKSKNADEEINSINTLGISVTDKYGNESEIRILKIPSIEN